MSKIIFIPSDPVAQPRTLPVQGLGHTSTPAGMQAIQHSYHVRIEETQQVSPFGEAAALIGLKRTLEVTDDYLMARYWDRSDMIEWIEANARKPVIVQRMTVNQFGWRLGFADTRDHEDVYRHLYSVSYRGRFEYNVTEPVYNEMVAWARENLSADHVFRRNGYGRWLGQTRISVMFRDLNEAALFKMRWHGEGRDGQ